MSTSLPDAPTFDNPIQVEPRLIKDHYEGKFSRVWLGWLLSLNRAVQDLQTSLPVSSSAFGLVSGPGPVAINVVLTMRRPGTLNIIGSILQTWVTGAPSWLVEVLIDGVVANTTGTISNTWQNMVTTMLQTTVTAGVHTVTIRWTTGSSNATLQSMIVDVFPVYTK